MREYIEIPKKFTNMFVCVTPWIRQWKCFRFFFFPFLFCMNFVFHHLCLLTHLSRHKDDNRCVFWLNCVVDASLVNEIWCVLYLHQYTGHLWERAIQVFHNRKTEKWTQKTWVLTGKRQCGVWRKKNTFHPHKYQIENEKQSKILSSIFSGNVSSVGVSRLKLNEILFQVHFRIISILFYFFSIDFLNASKKNDR